MASKRRFLRTPEGAWYRGYAGLKPRSIYEDLGYFDSPPNDDKPFYHGSQSQRDPAPNNAREAFLYDPKEEKRNRQLNALMANYYGDESHSHRPYPDRRSWDQGRVAAAAGKRAEDDSYLPKDDPRLYDDAAFARPAPRRGNDFNDFKLYDPQDFRLYDPSARNSPVDLKYHESHPRQNGPPADFRSYDPPARNSPVDFKSFDPPRQNGPSGDLKLFDPPARKSPVDLRLIDLTTRRNDPPAEYHHYDSSPRHAGPGDGGRQFSKYPPPPAPAGEREWEHHGRFSPRRMGAPYEPSFQDPRASSRNIPLWERDRGQPRLPLPAEDQGQVRVEGQSTQRSENSKRGDSVFLFIRFDRKNLNKVDQACQAAKPRTMRGEFVGLAERVEDLGDISGKNSCGCAVFLFPSLDQAEEFFYRDRHLRQSEWEVSAVSLTMDPGTVMTYFRTFLFSELTLAGGMSEENLREYHDKFVVPFKAFMKAHGALAFVALTDRGGRRSLRWHTYGRHDLCVLHLFWDQHHYEYVQELPRYRDLRDTLDAFSTERCSSVFTVRPELCP